MDSRWRDQWNHVDTVKNPADLGTQGFTYPELMEGDWLQTPLWTKDEDWISHIDQIGLKNVNTRMINLKWPVILECLHFLGHQFQARLLGAIFTIQLSRFFDDASLKSARQIERNVSDRLAENCRFHMLVVIAARIFLQANLFVWRRPSSYIARATWLNFCHF